MKIKVIPHSIVVNREYNILDIQLSKRGIMPHQFCRVLKTRDGKELAEYLLYLDTSKTKFKYNKLSGIILYFKNYRKEIYGIYTDRFKDKWISCYNK